MKRASLLATVTVGTIAVGLAGPAAAQNQSECLQDLAEIESTHLGVLEHMSSFELRSLSTLRNAAHVLVRTEHEDTCEEVVEAVGEMLAERRQELVDAGLMVEVDDEARLAKLKNAQHVNDLAQPVRAGDIIGGDLRNMHDEYLGEIDDVVFDPDGRQITHALVSVGGFLGLGEELIAVPLGALRVTDNLNTYVVEMTRERFDEAPRLEGAQIEQVHDQAWRDQNDLYYTIAAN